MQFDTRRGIFGPIGRGSGIFSPAIGGLGAVHGLGAVVPASCWNIPGFKDCNTEAGHQAFRVCTDRGLKSGGAGWDSCYSAEVSKNVDKCVAAFCAPKTSSTVKPGSGLPPSAASMQDLLATSSESGGGISTSKIVIIAGVASLAIGGFIVWRNRAVLFPKGK